MKLPAVEELTDSVELLVPPDETETLAGFKERLSPDGEPVADRDTVPAKLLRLASEIVEVDDDPALKFREVGFALIEKSAGALTETVTVVECESVPLVPVIATA